MISQRIKTVPVDSAMGDAIYLKIEYFFDTGLEAPNGRCCSIWHKNRHFDF